MSGRYNIQVFNIGRTEVDRAEVQRWLKAIGVEGWEHPLSPGDKEAYLESHYDAYPEDIEDLETVSDPAYLIALAAKNCYMSFEEGLNPNVTRVRKSYVDYFDNVLKQAHGSVLEHATYTYAIEGCTRVLTAELNRHRAGWAISERSLRYCRFDKEIPFWVPNLFRDEEGDSDDLAVKKEATRMLFNTAFAHQEQTYQKLCNLWGIQSAEDFTTKKLLTSAFRRVVGMGVCTGGVWTGNIRALRHVIAMRCSPHAEEEICHTFSLIAKHLIEREPMLFGDFEQDGEFFVPKYRKV